MNCAYCNKPVLARGMCSKHYTRQRSHGSPHVLLSPRGAAQAFIASVRPQESCITWPFKAKYKGGYGAVFYEGKLTGAHRAVCHIHHGNPPTERHHAAHQCGNRLCVNPAHLRWATPKENEADKIGHGKAPHGEANGCAKLTAEQVCEIRKLKGTDTQTAIAKKFGVSRRTVGAVLNNETWKAA